ncbi:anthranilate phosphoribosyltransferase [Staphylococcus muscae]|uniref:Anthranilate phosphoribosyltransferase n=1 Tax=Staphylococcus muscae TaxID=1294 RepID=A0A240C9T8_9STAP|nr:anthranilate phosphoribosyltransferase [Staphylococcus muscae]AVQ33812.1 anthranilate phosphoribosyltransferase [Staphylococcus muscae]PNZ06319.1 anthranilate phosphoribosyltransferase [Staphylococcus muscae]GGA87913.1 anthranilate phosphoribosyltransferase [Staphylococcus muscae]SNW04342.1 anthranilate phosphoribosyltransferase [Staphylococcus muscae]
MTLLKDLIQHQQLNTSQIEQFTTTLLSDSTELAEKLALLTAFTMKGATADELYDLSRAMIRTMYPEQPHLTDSICVCGTGGDGSNSFNISTTVAFVVAAAGAKVVKHGNKSVTSQSGSVDILQALDVPITQVTDVSQQVASTNLAFLNATNTYPIMRHLQPVRQQLPVPTVFNLLGPIINPFALDYQVMGVYDKTKMQDIAETLYKLGRQRALVVHGANGMDEATLSGDNVIVEVNQDTGIRTYTLNANEVGLRYAEDTELVGGTPEENKEITLGILKGKDMSCRRDVVLLNAGLALYAAKRVETIEAGVTLARQTIDEGHAYEQYEKNRSVAV